MMDHGPAWVRVNGLLTSDYGLFAESTRSYGKYGDTLTVTLMLVT